MVITNGDNKEKEPLYELQHGGDAIVKHCGGLANFIHVTNCMTRVRMTIADTSTVDMTALKAIEGY
ncbi:PTS transporter subunit EIIB [Klebsiella pneumoniae]|uniref:PTS transporter subunit EIIB n=1 Tax=Klebsiella pneumoniae TaxID=573 RepID=UPI003B438D86